MLQKPLTNKTITTATINGNSTIGGSTKINTTGPIASGAATVTGSLYAPAQKKPLSVQCWAGGNNSVASTQINASGQVNAGNPELRDLSEEIPGRPSDV